MRRTLLVLVVLALAFAAACGDDGRSCGAETESRDAASSRASAPASGVEIDVVPEDCHDAVRDDGQADLEMRDNAFAPSCVLISTSQGLRIHNEGDNEHNFTVEGFGLDVDVSPGDENNTEATGLEPGSYTFFCKYHRTSDDMEGKLVVRSA